MDVGSGANGVYTTLTEKQNVPKDSPSVEEVAKMIGERALVGWRMVDKCGNCPIGQIMQKGDVTQCIVCLQ